MNGRNPYFTLSGMAFQTPGDEIETEINSQIAMSYLETYAKNGTGEKDAAEALAYLEREFPKISVFCEDMRIAFILDDFQDDELKRRIIVRAYNRIVDRMNGKPISKWDV